MFITNYHTHSSFCDGSGSLEDYVKSGINRNFNILGFSGHAPLPFENDWTISKKELKTYLNRIEELKEIYKDRIELKAGLEVDFVENLTGPSSKYFKEMDLDFVIGSIHMLYDSDTDEYLSIDYKKSEIEQLINVTFKGDVKLLVKEYYRAVRLMSEQGGFDIIGHLDVIKKNNINSIYFDETESWYKREIERTLDCIGSNKQMMEINTGYILKDPSAIYPSPWILKIAREFKIPIVINSDAHRPQRIDNYFTEAAETAQKCGYTSKMILSGDKWSEVSIG